MPDFQKMKEACIVPLDIWKEEIDQFVKNVKAKMNCEESELLNWIYKDGQQFFNASQQKCYLNLLERYGLIQMYPVCVEEQIEAGFNSLYDIFQKPNNPRLFDSDSIIDVDALLQMNNNKKQTNYPTTSDFNLLLKNCLSKHSAIIFVNTTYLNDLHKFLEENPSTIITNEFIYQFKFNHMKKAQEEISQQCVAMSQLCEQKTSAGLMTN
jgi:hypothetical protein